MPPPVNFNWSGYNSSADTHYKNKTQMTPDEYAGFGGDLGDYSNLYGHTAWYSPNGNYTAGAPLSVKQPWLDTNKFQELQRRRGSEGSQITPYEYVHESKGRLEDYGKIYGNTSWYNPDGSLTGNAPAGTLPPPSTDSPLTFPKMEDTPVSIAPATGYRDFLPKQLEDSEQYVYQKDRALDDLNKYLAAKGLLKSGRQVEAAAREVIAPLRADESERQKQYAEKQAGRAQEVNLAQAGLNENLRSAKNDFNRVVSDRLIGLKTDQAGRTERYNNEQWNRLAQVLNLMFAQSPTGLGLSGAQGAAGVAEQKGQATSNILSQIANTLGSQAGYVAPPIPSSPNYSNVNQLGNQFSNANQQGWGNLFGNVLSHVFR